MKKKIFKLTTIFCLLLFFLCLTTAVDASTDSQALVAEGRSLLFNNGNPTYSGILSANAKFEAAVAADSSDPEANLFYAVTRILAFGLEQGSGTGFETFRDLFEAFGISRNDVDLVELDDPFNEPPFIYDQYDPPTSIPGGEDVRTFLAGPFLTLLDAAIANLNAIPYTTSNITTLLSTEIDDDHDIEVDYGDILLFKSALYTLKSSILIATAYNLDVDIRELVVLGNAGVLQLQRDILDKYSNLLSLRTADGATSLANAKTALLNGINAYDAAFNFITGETDDKFDDLFYFESGEDQREAEFVLTQLTELKSSLNNNRVAEFTIINETWVLTDENNKRLRIEIEKDVNGNFVSGYARGLDGCDFLFCSGWVEEFTVSGTTVTIEMGSNWWCGPIYYALTGTAQYDGNQVTGIENGNYSWTDCEGAPKSGTFTGMLVNSETETETIDFNLIFGNAGKSPLNIRSILPEFDQYNEPVPGTFGIPILNGIVPEFATNDDLTREMELQPSGEFLIPDALIGVQDGYINDWIGIDPVFVDITGEDEYDFSGDDIVAVYLAKDTEYLYVRMTLTKPPNILPPDANGSMHYFVQLARSRHASAWSDRYFGVKYNSGNWEVMVHQYAGYYVIGNHPTGFAQAVENDLEWKVPLNELELPFTGRYLNTWSHWTPGSYNCSDGNHTKLRVGPLASISGTITYPDYTSGNIFICARDASTGRTLGKTYITSPGTYTITGLPVEANVNIFARWDVDDNGIKTFGDYVGMTGPITVASGGTTGEDFSLDTLIDDSFIMTKPGVYRVLGSNTYNVPQYYYGPWNPNEIAWDRSEWTFIGESNKTETFSTAQYYKTILMVWHENSSFNFDAIEDQIAGTAFTIDEYGNSTSYNWVTSGLRNSDTDQRSEPYYFKGYPDGLYANTTEWYGFNLFSMPDDSVDNSTSRQLKISLISTLTGDVDGDKNVNLADAILALKVIAKLNSPDINLNADVNGDGKIGLAEVIYILQYVAGLR